MSNDIKAFLYAWCCKKKLTPNYEVRNSGPKHRQRFLCELRVEGFPYTGCGHSTSKKDAQTNAAQDFVTYLIRQGEFDASNVPEELRLVVPVKQEGNSNMPPTNASKPIVYPERNAYQPFNNDGEKSYQDLLAERARVEDAELVDMNAGIHGNWTVENAKSKLHQFLQMRKITVDYSYNSVGPDHNKSFIAEMSFYVNELKRNVAAREHGSNKQIASKNCALSLVRQLYHLNVIEAFSGTLARKKVDCVPEFDSHLTDETLNKLTEACNIFNIPKFVMPTDFSNPVSVINESKFEAFLKREKNVGGGVVSWSPPQQNWHPWASHNIDEDVKPLEEISSDLMNAFQELTKVDVKYQEMKIQREKLPVAGCRHQIMELIHNNSVIIIKGDTGCGKTTQVPQFILDDYILTEQGAECSIVITQPRRISAISVAERVAYERSENVGYTVGYSVRFESMLPCPHGSIMFCTVGVLLRKLENGLRGISHVVIDEIHERDLNTDFLLVVVRDMVQAYPEMRVILMSATIDTSIFSSYFGDCPVFEVPGRLHPVTTYFLEDVIQTLNFYPSQEFRRKKKERDKEMNELNVDEQDDNLNLVCSPDYSPAVKEAMAQLNEKDLNFELILNLLKHIDTLDRDGAVLIFLPGWNLIMTLLKFLESNLGGGKVCLLPLHSQLPKEDQRAVFLPSPSGMRKVILSTNIAESAITIDDVVFVIDSCKAKIKLFTSHNNMTNYATVWASQSSLEQRKGRAGRVKPGYCFRLCSKARYEKLDVQQTPEMLRTSLHEVALAIKLLRLGAIGSFLAKALEPPPLDAVIEAEVLLREMRALDVNDDLTPLGKILAKLPIEPRMGKTLVIGCIFGVGDAMCTIAAQSSTVSEIFVIGPYQRRLGFKEKSLAGVRSSDHAALLNAFQMWSEASCRGEMEEIHLCDSYNMSAMSLRMVNEAKIQIKNLLLNSGFPESCLAPRDYNYYGRDLSLDVALGLLCVGLYPNVCYHMDKRKVLTQEGKAALIHKSSVNCSNMEQKFSLPFFIFGEKLRTRAVSCKQMTMVTPIHLLLLGAKRVEGTSADTIRLDNWINLKISPEHAHMIISLRPILEDTILKITQYPDKLDQLEETDQQFLDVIRSLLNFESITCVTESDSNPQTSAAAERIPWYKRGTGMRARGPRRPMKRHYTSMSPSSFMGRGDAYDPGRNGKFAKMGSFGDTMHSYNSEGAGSYAPHGNMQGDFYRGRGGRPGPSFGRGYVGRGTFSPRRGHPHSFNRGNGFGGNSYY